MRNFTVIFKVPGKYTIKAKVVDTKGNIVEGSKTLTVQTLSIIEAIEYGKNLCGHVK